MTRRRSSLFHSWCCLALLLACTSESDSGDTSDASAPGEDSGASDAGTCEAGEPGTLAVTIDIPAGIAAAVTLREEAERLLTASEEIELGSGEVTLTAKRVTVPGDLVGKAYYPASVETSVCVKAGERTEVTIRYELEPGSEKLWVLGGAGDYHTASYAAADLAATGAPTPSATLSGSTTNPSTLAFDGHGNLWIADSTGKVLGYARDSLGTARSSAPDIVLDGPTICAEIVPCGPRALAFDALGDLWLAMPKQVTRISADQLEESGQPEASSVLSGESLDDPQSLAFDASGALWVGEWKENTVMRFAADRLSADDAGMPDVVLAGQTPPPVLGGLSGPAALSFDAGGNLWAGYFGPNVIARYTPADQAAGGMLTPAVQLKVGVLALIEGMAFDEAGNLWLTGKSGQVARIAKSALTSSDSDLNAGAVFITVEGSAQDLAFNPSADGTPLAR